ncbi:MAG: hypothetical protein MMC33_008447 [Icmadophila ericetorum]|nr:hypothetical protein [Icmadophila ericetorum]
MNTLWLIRHPYSIAGASLSGPGPLAEGLMAFTTPVPLPSPAQLPTPQRGHSPAPAQANKLHQGFSLVKGGNVQQAGSESQSRSRTASQRRDTGPAQTGTCTNVSGKRTLVCTAAPASATDPHRMDSISQVGTSPHKMPCQGGDTSVQPSQLVHTCGMPDEGQASAGQGTKEGIAEVLTGHLHAWGKTLQKLRRAGRCLPEEGTPEPDMQPLGRAFIGQPVEPNLARPSQQKGLQRQRAPSRLSREVSAEEAFMLAHASECAAEVARQPATGSVLHAACQKLHDEQRAAQKAAILHPCCASSSPMDVEGTMTTTGLNKRGRRRSITDMPIPEGAELSTVHGICGSPVVSPHVLASTSCSLTEVRTSMDPLVLPL